jgi:hypothetical protein
VNRADQPSSDLDPLFESAKALDRVSDVARARVRARARATLAAASASSLPVATPQKTSHSRLALAAGVAFVLGATGTAAAFLGPAFLGPFVGRHGSVGRRAAPTTPLPRVTPTLDVAAPTDDPIPSSAASPPVVTATAPERHRHASRAGDPRAAELTVIQKAQAAYADGNLPSALELLAEHERRFPHGRLAEERDALRVRSLAGCGRATDARRALEVFADRYPHSVLLPHLREALGTGTRP